MSKTRMSSTEEENFLDKSRKKKKKSEFIKLLNSLENENGSTEI